MCGHCRIHLRTHVASLSTYLWTTCNLIACFFKISNFQVVTRSKTKGGNSLLIPKETVNSKTVVPCYLTKIMYVTAQFLVTYEIRPKILYKIGLFILTSSRLTFRLSKHLFAALFTWLKRSNENYDKQCLFSIS